MENLLAQLGTIREHGIFALACAADRSWTGQAQVPVFGPDRISPNAMAAVMSEVLGRPVAFRQLSFADVEFPSPSVARPRACCRT